MKGGRQRQGDHHSTQSGRRFGVRSVYTLAGKWGTGSHPLVLLSIDVSRQSTGLAETMRLKASKSVQVNGSAKRSKQPARIGKDNSSRNRDGWMLDVGQHGGQSKARVGDETRPTIALGSLLLSNPPPLIPPLRSHKGHKGGLALLSIAPKPPRLLQTSNRFRKSRETPGFCTKRTGQ